MEEQLMRRALELAGLGAGFVNPNPLVGAVIVRDGRVIGEGYHRKCGGPHAEVEALENAVEDVEGATLYVTLEPCSHTGRTPPCAHRIVEAGIARVVVGVPDPNPLVAGGGIRYLREAGVEVTVGVLEEEGRRLNEIFLHYITRRRPFVTWKTAMTLDGKIATHTGDSRWVTGPEARERVHRMRHRMAGILVGVGTVLADDPALTTRLPGGGGSDPVRIIADSGARTPLSARVLAAGSPSPTVIAVTEEADPGRIAALEARGAQVVRTPAHNGRVDLPRLLEELGAREIDSLLLEGGAGLAGSMLEQGLVDKAACFIAPKLVGGAGAKSPLGGAGIPAMADAVRLGDVRVKRIGGDILVEGYPQRKEEDRCSQD